MEGAPQQVRLYWKLIAVSLPAGFALGYITSLNVNLKIEQLIWLVFTFLIAIFHASFLDGRYFKHGIITGAFTVIFSMLTHIFRATELIGNHMEIAKMISESGKVGSSYFVICILDFSKGIFYALSQGIFNTVVGVAVEKIRNPK
jgi:hypothetical protein